MIMQLKVFFRFLNIYRFLIQVIFLVLIGEINILDILLFFFVLIL